jgi:hypothetical protein
MNPDQLDKYGSAITLSDMEVFVFPELMYSLVLANIMSPIIWKWREADCFKKLEGKSPYKKLMRLRQFIMDEYEFNLDLDTWVKVTPCSVTMVTNTILTWTFADTSGWINTMGTLSLTGRQKRLKR